MPKTGQDGHGSRRHSSAEAWLDARLERAAEGDHDAFADVYDALARAVKGLICRVLMDEAQAEEVTQDVMVEIWRTADRYRPELGTARGWVLTLAHRRAVDRVRYVQASTARERRSALLAEDRPFDEVAEAVERHEDHHRVRRCLAALERHQRVPLVLAYYQGMTYLEVAACLATPAGTVKSRMRAGLRLLRGCLEARR
ncbi:ECF RNA polymerase sigma factor SigK [Streptomyces sp. NPDC086182]|jgi:RNA polymerase sigma-70 factor (ECF subfamily)|uniref:ECF RNA polymerase sigma factor SigK n=1 Tax=Streptomyces sp. NPDC086182 TaxID=3155058 RepID=UPI003441788B